MMYISRKEFPDISDSAFKLLRRIAVLTRKGEQPCNYTNVQAKKELGMSAATVESCNTESNQYKFFLSTRACKISGYKRITVSVLCQYLEFVGGAVNYSHNFTVL